MAQAPAPKWHSADERLSEPTSQSHFTSSAIYFNRYDSIPCVYVTTSGAHQRSGYKVVYVKNGYYTDNGRTFGVFLNDRFERISGVRRYYFK